MRESVSQLFMQSVRQSVWQAPVREKLSVIQSFSEAVWEACRQVGRRCQSVIHAVSQ